MSSLLQVLMVLCEAPQVPQTAGEPGGSPRGWKMKPGALSAGKAGRRKIKSTKIERGELVACWVKGVTGCLTPSFFAHCGCAAGASNAANGHRGSETWSAVSVSRWEGTGMVKPCRTLLCQNKEATQES